jgi:8-oxo-dGTP pyrophosphatase MutT (NUDIX family)
LEEELGITSTEWAYIRALPEPDPERHGAGQYHFYLVTAWDGTPYNRATHEHERVEWFSLDRAVRLELAHPAYADLFARLLGNT